jgi:glycosyltransferase involved in cell wall biosynthesis
MQTLPLVSIIIPVYNAEKYLNQCIESILNQTYKNIEVILVNDGSSDNSGIICDNYANTDNRIKVIHQINQGVSSARNRGIENSKGEFLSFVDSDDWILDKYLEDLLSPFLEEKNVDLVICDFIKDSMDIGPISEFKKIIYNDDDIKKNVKEDVNSDKRIFGYSVVAKCFRKCIILNNNIRFDNDSSGKKFIERYRSIKQLCNLPEIRYFSINYSLPKGKDEFGNIVRYFVYKNQALILYFILYTLYKLKRI